MRQEVQQTMALDISFERILPLVTLIGKAGTGENIVGV